MNTGYTTVDNYFKSNYDTLRDYCQKYNIDEDKINDIYLKMKRLNPTGMTINQMFQYTRTGIWNKIRDESRLRTRRGHSIEINECNIDRVEEKLREEDYSDNWQYRDEIEWLTKMVFLYISQRKIFSDIDVFILKSYVFTDKTYAELEKEIGISQDICKKTMRKFRNDLRNNFIDFIKKYKNG